MNYLFIYLFISSNIFTLGSVSLHLGVYIYYYTSERVIRPGIARVCRYFPRAEGEGKYYTRVKYLAVLPFHECNDRFIIYYL